MPLTYCCATLSARDVARFLHTRKSVMTLTAATRTSAQSAAFETVSIVPSISMAWIALPATMTTASSVWAMRHVRGRSRRRKRSQNRDGEDRPHGDHTKGGERRRRCEQKRVNHVRRTGEPKACDVDHDSHDQRASDPVMHTPPDTARQSRQISADQKRLNEHDAQRDNAGESGQDVDRTAPCELRARRRGGDRHANGCRKGDPDQGDPGQSPSPGSQRDQTD